MQVACDILLKSSQRGLQLCFRPHRDQRFAHKKLWGSKVAKILTLAISGLLVGSPEIKSHLDVGLVEKHKVYYKGEGGGFPQVQAVVSLYEYEFACGSS